MKNKKKISKIRTKELKRVKQAISRLEKKGFQIASEFKDLAKLSTQKLKTITPKVLRRTASGYWQGEKVSGKELYKRQREELKLIRKRKRGGVIFEKDENTYEDGTNINDLKTDTILRRLYELAKQYDDYEVEHIRRNAMKLKEILDDEVKKYGKMKVAISAEENARTNYDTGETIVFASTAEELKTGVATLINNIEGYIPNEEENEVISEYIQLIENAHYMGVDEDE